MISLIDRSYKIHEYTLTACSIYIQPQDTRPQAEKMTIALTSATGKLGGGVLNDILENKLIDTKELVICV
jgi:hypothetical protein